MRGQVLGVDLKTGEGQIAGDDGNRYVFRPGDWGDRTGPAVGLSVDFEASDKRALSIYRVPGAATALAAADPVETRPARRIDRNKIVAALLAFFIGPLGVHRFYLGRQSSAILMLVLSITIIGLIVTLPWALVDFVRYLLMSDAEFDRRYGYED